MPMHMPYAAVVVNVCKWLGIGAFAAAAGSQIGVGARGGVAPPDICNQPPANDEKTCDSDDKCKKDKTALEFRKQLLTIERASGKIHANAIFALNRAIFEFNGRCKPLRVEPFNLR